LPSSQKHKEAKDVAIGNKFVGDADYDALRTMDFKGLREMLPGTDEATLGFIFRFFDANLDGRINTVEFLMAVAMLCHPCDTAQEQLDACFRMFDSDDSGCLSRTVRTQHMRPESRSPLSNPQGRRRRRLRGDRGRESSNGGSSLDSPSRI